MPTDTGGETIGERLTRLRADLARVRATIARVENNGQEFRQGFGTSVTQVAYEQAQARETKLVAEISALEVRLANSASPRLGLAQTSMP